MNYTKHKTELPVLFRNPEMIFRLFEENARAFMNELGVNVPKLSHVFTKYYLKAGDPSLLQDLLVKQREKLYEQARLKHFESQIR